MYSSICLKKPNIHTLIKKYFIARNVAHPGEATPHPSEFCREMAAVQSHPQAPPLRLVLAVSATSAVTSSTEVSSPLKSSLRVGINFLQTPVNVDILTSSHESRMFLMASRMVPPFQKVLNLFCPNSSEE